MPKKILHTAQLETTDTGTLEISVTSSLGYLPIQGAKISILSTDNPEIILDEVTTDESGQTVNLELPAPPVEYSLAPGEARPYAEYDFLVEAEGYEPVRIIGSEILADTKSLQPILMIPLEGNQPPDTIIIPDHTLYGDYPPKIPEDEIKPIDESGEIVLSRVVIPEYIVVHDGLPNNASAKNYYVLYKDYIKNVVSSEIYATWPENTIYANTLAILSFTLNRVYTEW